LLVVMHREGWEVGKQRFYRLYTEEGLALGRKRPWRHATAALARNEVWSMDFVADQLADGRRDRSVHA
jgi:putative transposase